MKNLSLNKILEQVWKAIKDGIKDGSSSFHISTISTINLQGYPSSRSIVIRSLNKAKRIISFNTDTRSYKWKELETNSQLALHFYDSKLKIQIRISGSAKLHYNDLEWDKAEEMSKIYYSSPFLPSSKIDDPIVTDNLIKNIKRNQIEKGGKNFARTNVKINKIDWLYLLHTGHRRALFKFHKNNISMSWIAP